MKLIGHLKVRTKLISSFLIVAILIGIVGIIGALSLRNVNNRAQEMHDISLQHVKEILSIKANMSEKIVARTGEITTTVGKVSEVIQSMAETAQKYNEQADKIADIKS
jgi:methyl-accepting chemotaxis protein